MIETSRLKIKPFCVEDAADFLQLTQDEGFRLFPITNYVQADVNSSREWIGKAIELNQQKALGKWGVWEKGSSALIGMGGLTPWSWEGEELIDITYRLRQSAWGKGLGLELAEALVEYGFAARKLSEITATITPDNLPSKKIAEKLGLKFDKHIVLLGVPTDLYRLRRENVGRHSSD